MKRFSLLLASLAVVAVSIGCASVRVAQNKTLESEGQKFDLGGTYDPRGSDLTLTVDGDPIMRGRFPPYTPTLRLNGKYKNQAVSASCYFGTVLGSRGGIGGIVAGSIQGAKGKSGDKCATLRSVARLNPCSFSSGQANLACRETISRI